MQENWKVFLLLRHSCHLNKISGMRFFSNIPELILDVFCRVLFKEIGNTPGKFINISSDCYDNTIMCFAFFEEFVKQLLKVDTIMSKEYGLKFYGMFQLFSI